MNKRKEGWYWVKASESHPWEICHFEDNGWWREEFSSYKYDPYWPVVGPRIPEPDEPWICVPKEPTPEMAMALRVSDSGGVDHWAVDRIKRILAAAPSTDG